MKIESDRMESARHRHVGEEDRVAKEQEEAVSPPVAVGQRPTSLCAAPGTRKGVGEGVKRRVLKLTLSVGSVGHIDPASGVN